MNDCAKKEKDSTEKGDKFKKILRLIEVVSAVVSSVVALIAVILSFVSLNHSRDLLDYQIKQDLLPKVVLLNDEISSSFECRYIDEIYNYDSINGMRIPVYNLGVGIAQNCKINWDAISVKNACIKAKDVLESYVSITEYDYLKDGFPSFLVYDYLFEYKNNKLTRIRFYDNAEESSCELAFVEEMIKIPYILPVSEQEINIFINVPKTVAVLLLEYGNHNIKDSIDIELDVSYEDIFGEKFMKTYIVNFTVEKRTIIESEKPFENDTVNCFYGIKVNEG